MVEAEATLAHLAQTTGDLRYLTKELSRIEQYLKDAKQIMASWGRDPNAPGAHDQGWQACDTRWTLLIGIS